MSHRRGQAGFTLIELMVSAAVAMLLLAGAFEMHAAFNRQNVRQQEVADMQQALRVATQVIGRSVRDAGTGLFGGTMQLYDGNIAAQPCPKPTGAGPTNSTIDPNSTCFFGAQYGNRMPYQNPPVAFDNVPAGDNDPDDDWLRVVSFDGTTAVGVVRTDPANNPAGGVLSVTDTRNFTLHGFFYVGNAYPAMLDGNNQPTLGWRSGCVRQATAIVPAPNPTAALPTPGLVTFAAGAYNPSPDPCVPRAFDNVPGQARTIYVYPVDRSVVFRIQPPSAPGVVPVTPPQLQAWYSSPTQPSWLPEAVASFQTLTENIEHMQVALVLSDGTLCGNATNSIDNPGNVVGSCNFQNVRAVRLTLVARSSSSWFGWLSQGVGGRWEDFAQPAVNDGYLRRTVTTEIEIRNDPWGQQ